jgi:hypothetical protein
VPTFFVLYPAVDRLFDVETSTVGTTAMNESNRTESLTALDREVDD